MNRKIFWNVAVKMCCSYIVRLLDIIKYSFYFKRVEYTGVEYCCKIILNDCKGLNIQYAGFCNFAGCIWLFIVELVDLSLTQFDIGKHIGNVP